jgi:hypothetical protein
VAAALLLLPLGGCEAILGGMLCADLYGAQYSVFCALGH